MSLILQDTTSEVTARPDTVPIDYELEFESLSPVSDTVPCPPPDWEELELE